MEKALLIQPSDILKIDADLLQKFDAIYLGSDFCPNLMPSQKEVDGVRKRWHKKIIVSTSILTGKNVEKTLCFINKVFARAQITEVVVNDWGMLYALKDTALQVSLGRLLFHQFKNYPKQFLIDFFKKYRVSKVEIDDQGRIQDIPENIEISFHYHLRFLSLTRFCPHTKKSVSQPCRGKICRKKIVPLYSASAKKAFYLNANAYFELDHSAFDRTRVSRAIFLPKIGSLDGQKKDVQPVT